MQLTGLLITHRLPDEGVEWFTQVRDVVDELVVIVDAARAEAGLHDKLRRLDARVVSTGGALFNADFRQMVAACRGDWILKIDYDEELSPEWKDPAWRCVLEKDFTHFWCRRRWLTSQDRYISEVPWWPDWQLRLFRNLPDEIVFPTKLHENLTMSGAAGYLRTLSVYHHDLRLASRTEREAKAAEYERRQPGNGLGFFYLYEDYRPPESPRPTGSELDLAREILEMERLTDAEVAQLRIEPQVPPASLERGQLFWLDVGVSNGTGRSVGFGGPHPLNVAYHWLDAAAATTIVFNGERTALLPQIPAGGSAVVRMFVIAPPVAGTYVLRIALVQEHARWLDLPDSPTSVDFPVAVL